MIFVHDLVASRQTKADQTVSAQLPALGLQHADMIFAWIPPPPIWRYSITTVFAVLNYE